MQVMLLAAGRSTRLGELGVARPKPLVPICGYPAIVFNLHLCALAGLDEVVINLHHHGDQIRDAVGDGSRWGLRVRYSEELDLLGTGGGIVQARTLFSAGPVLVINGKVVADLPLRPVIAAHQARGRGTLATMVLRRQEAPGRFAPVAVDQTGRVVGLRGRPGKVAPSGMVSDWMFTGIHVLEPALLDLLPPVGSSDVIADGYQPALEAGARIMSFTHGGYFEEHSTPESYLAGNLALLRQPGLLRAPPGPLTGLDPLAAVHPSVIIQAPVRIAAGASIEAGAVVGPDVVVCSGARVGAQAHLERTVVWDGAEASGDLADTVVTAQGVVDVRTIPDLRGARSPQRE
jgi:mannose-1-phosphate guanylyltransferase